MGMFTMELQSGILPGKVQNARDIEEVPVLRLSTMLCYCPFLPCLSLTPASPCSPPPTHPLQVDKGTPVAIFAEEKDHAMAVGLTLLSTQEMRDVNKGIGVELLHHLNDGLWKTPKMH